MDEFFYRLVRRLVLTRIFASVLLAVAIPALALNVTLTAKAEGGDRPVVVGITNLPDGTELMVKLSRKESAYMAQSKTVVSAGNFRAGPFSQKGSALNPGIYALEVSMPLAAVQPPVIWPTIGNEGSKLVGPLVKRSSFGGKVVQYATTIRVGVGTSSAPADTAARAQSKEDAHAWWLQSCNSTCNLTQGLAQRRGEAFNFDRCYFKCVADEPASKK